MFASKVGLESIVKCLFAGLIVSTEVAYTRTSVFVKKAGRATSAILAYATIVSTGCVAGLKRVNASMATKAKDVTYPSVGLHV